MGTKRCMIYRMKDSRGPDGYMYHAEGPAIRESIAAGKEKKDKPMKNIANSVFMCLVMATATGYSQQPVVKESSQESLVEKAARDGLAKEYINKYSKEGTDVEKGSGVTSSHFT